MQAGATGGAGLPLAAERLHQPVPPGLAANSLARIVDRFPVDPKLLAYPLVGVVLQAEIDHTLFLRRQIVTYRIKDQPRVPLLVSPAACSAPYHHPGAADKGKPRQGRRAAAGRRGGYSRVLISETTTPRIWQSVTRIGSIAAFAGCSLMWLRSR